MDLGLAGRRALLVGAGRGLGAASARALARERCSVALVARTRASVEERAAECHKDGAPKAVAIAADATVPEEIARAVQTAARELGGLDILVTLVGGSAPGGTGMDDAGWTSALDRNLWPAIRAAREALPLLEAAARERGFAAPEDVDSAPARDLSVIVHVASIWGREGRSHQPRPRAGTRARSARHPRPLRRARKHPAPGRLVGAPPRAGSRGHRAIRAA